MKQVRVARGLQLHTRNDFAYSRAATVEMSAKDTTGFPTATWLSKMPRQPGASRGVLPLVDMPWFSASVVIESNHAGMSIRGRGAAPTSAALTTPRARGGATLAAPPKLKRKGVQASNGQPANGRSSGTTFGDEDMLPEVQSDAVAAGHSKSPLQKYYVATLKDPRWLCRRG